MRPASCNPRPAPCTLQCTLSVCRLRSLQRRLLKQHCRTCPCTSCLSQARAPTAGIFYGFRGQTYEFCENDGLGARRLHSAASAEATALAAAALAAPAAATAAVPAAAASACASASQYQHAGLGSKEPGQVGEVTAHTASMNRTVPVSMKLACDNLSKLARRDSTYLASTCSKDSARVGLVGCSRTGRKQGGGSRSTHLDQSIRPCPTDARKILYPKIAFCGLKTVITLETARDLCWFFCLWARQKNCMLYVVLCCSVLGCARWTDGQVVFVGISCDTPVSPMIPRAAVQ